MFKYNSSKLAEVVVNYRSVFVSDIHLGTKESKTENFLNFLKEVECENLFLVGDIIDGWAIKRKLIWTQNHSDVIQKILRKARKGTRVVYVVGNHDDFVRQFLPLQLGNNITVTNEHDYLDIFNKRYLVTHGDMFDTITMTKKWIAVLGDRAYTSLLKLNRPLNRIRKFAGFKKYWSLSKYIKQNVKKSVIFICEFEEIMSNYAKKNNYDGVICGHIHHPEIKSISNILYLNCGDWVENCSALVEHHDGKWEILENLNLDE
jgi:UDP-2,3-diacylglucosamine pyrophosphatase LpxH